MMMVKESSEEDVFSDAEKTAETIPDNLSEGESSRGSNGSNNSAAPPLLDFIGNTCMASAWFTSCFPCAVVDINDSDDYVVDKLSRESAMNVMYGSSITNNNSLEEKKPEDDSDSGRSSDNVMFVSLPPKQQTEGNNIHVVPSVIQEEDTSDCDGSEEDARMEDVPLSSQKMGLAVPVTPTPVIGRQDPGIVDESATIPQLQPAAEAAAAANGGSISSTPRKKKFGMKKMFSRRNKV